MKLRTFFLSAVLLFVSTNSFAQEVQKTKLVTNKHRSAKIPVTKITEDNFEQNVYDLSLVAYDKEFSDEFGLNSEFVTKLDKGLRFIEAKMITEGKETNCYYNVVLDKNVEVAFPKDQNFFDKNNPIIGIDTATVFLPDEKDPTHDEKVKLMKKKKHLFNNNSLDIVNLYSNRLYIGTKDYKENKKVRAKNGSSLMYYIQDRFDYQILSIQGFCVIDAAIIGSGKSSIWIAKDKMNYSTIVNEDPDHFNKFSIPKSISDKISPILMEYRDDYRNARDRNYKPNLIKKTN